MAVKKAQEGPVLYTSWVLQLDKAASKKMITEAASFAREAEKAVQDARTQVATDGIKKRSDLEEKAKQDERASAEKNAQANAETLLNAVKNGSGKALSFIAKQTAGAFAAMGATGAGLLVASLTKGTQRLLSVEGATAGIVGQGFTDDFASQVLASVNSAVTGTAFGIDVGASIASTFVSSGVEDIATMDKMMRRTADAAALMGGDFQGVGEIFSNVIARGRVSAEDMARLVERGFGGWKALSEELGVSVAEVQSLMRAGQIDAETFFRIFDKNAGAAQRFGDSMKGAAANLGAAFGRSGQGLLLGSTMSVSGGVLDTGVWAEVRDLLKSATGWVNRLTDRTKAVGDQLAVSFAGPMQRLDTFFKTNDPTAFASLAGRALQTAAEVASQLLPLILDAPARFQGFIESISMTMSNTNWAGLGNSFLVWLTLVGQTVALVAPFVQGLLNMFAQFPELLPLIVGGLLVFRAVSMSLTAISAASAAVSGLATALDMVGKTKVIVVLGLIIGLITAAIVAIQAFKDELTSLTMDVGENLFGMDFSSARERVKTERRQRYDASAADMTNKVLNVSTVAPGGGDQYGGTTNIYYPQVTPTPEQQRRSGSQYSSAVGA